MRVLWSKNTNPTLTSRVLSITNAIKRPRRTKAPTSRATSRGSRPRSPGFGLASFMVRPAVAEIAVDHTVHVQDVAFLTRIQARPGPAGRAHPLLHVRKILVVLFGDLAPAPVAPVLEELRLHAPTVDRAGRAPLEHPCVLDRAIRIVSERPHPEQDRAAGIDRADDVREPEHVVGARHEVG